MPASLPARSLLHVSYLGDAPSSVKLDAYTFKCQISSFVQGKAVLRVGEVTPRASPTDKLPYSPGVWPFTFNLIGEQYTVEDWRGTPYVGYQAPLPWVRDPRY